MKTKIMSALFFLLLAPASYSTESVPQPAAACDLKMMNWSQVETVEVEMYSFRFEPNQLTFRACAPYRLLLVNRADTMHNFSADSFFATVLVKKDTGDLAAITDSDKAALDLQPNGETSLFFIAGTPGEYDFKCSHFGHAFLGMTGKITVTN